MQYFNKSTISCNYIVSQPTDHKKQMKFHHLRRSYSFTADFFYDMGITQPERKSLVTNSMEDLQQA